MLLIPAIDLKDGHCVRLRQGDMAQSTVFGDNPAAMARRWVDAGARRLHLVDLNGAFAGKPVNEAAVRAILAEVGNEIPVQLGGGIRDLDTIERYLDDGLSFVIIGTAAVKSPGFLQAKRAVRSAATSSWGSTRRDGKVATDGWSQAYRPRSGRPGEASSRITESRASIYTDIGRDGMLSGVNIDATVKLAPALCPSPSSHRAASAGSITDIERLCAVAA